MKSILVFALLLLCINSFAQENLSFRCAELNINKSISVKFDAVTEDDPGFLQEAYSYLPGFFLKNQKIEMVFPSHTGVFHWQAEGKPKESDTLSADLYYDTDPSVYGNLIDCHAKDFTITVKKYETFVNGVVEGSFSGTMEAFVASQRKSVEFEVSGTFRSTRSGHPSAVCRKFRSTEKLAINKLKDAINSLAEKWAGDDYSWRPASIGSHVSAGGSMPPRPIFICDGHGMALKLKESTALYQSKVAPMEAKYYSGNLDIDAMERMTYDMKNLQTTIVGIDVNSPYIWLISHVNAFVPKSTEKLSIDGVDLAYRFVTKFDTAYVLAFGEWSNLKEQISNTDKFYQYKFRHGIQQPFVENVVLKFHGTDEALRKIISTTDWKKIKEAVSY